MCRVPLSRGAYATGVYRGKTMRNANTTHQFAPRSRLRELGADRRGLSTLEYAVIFIVILIGGLALWKNLSRSLATQVGDGNAAFDSALGAAQRQGDTGEMPATAPGAQGPANPPPATATAPAAPAAPGPGAKKLSSF